jgi:hypothetical protein
MLTERLSLLLLGHAQGPPLVGQPAGDERIVGGLDLGRRIGLSVGPGPEVVVLLVEAQHGPLAGLVPAQGGNPVRLLRHGETSIGFARW